MCDKKQNCQDLVQKNGNTSTIYIQKSIFNGNLKSSVIKIYSKFECEKEVYDSYSEEKKDNLKIFRERILFILAVLSMIFQSYNNLSYSSTLMFSNFHYATKLFNVIQNSKNKSFKYLLLNIIYNNGIDEFNGDKIRKNFTDKDILQYVNLINEIPNIDYQNDFFAKIISRKFRKNNVDGIKINKIDTNKPLKVYVDEKPSSHIHEYIFDKNDFDYKSFYSKELYLTHLENLFLNLDLEKLIKIMLIPEYETFDQNDLALCFLNEREVLKEEKYKKYYDFMEKVEILFQKESLDEFFNYYLENIYNKNFQDNIIVYEIKNKEYFDNLDFKGCSYNTNNILGTGSFGEVIKYGDNAMKFINKEDLNINEIIISKFNHKNICKPVGIEFIDEVTIGLKLELCENFNIYSLTEFTTKKYILQLLDAVSFLQKNNFIHKDLSSNNLLIKNGDLKICDFGFCCNNNNSNYLNNSGYGTIIFTSPELVYEAKEYEINEKGQLYIENTDTWSCAILIIYFLLKESFIRKINSSLRELEDLYKFKFFLTSFATELYEGFDEYDFSKNKINPKRFYKTKEKELLEILNNYVSPEKYTKIEILNEGYILRKMLIDSYPKEFEILKQMLYVDTNKRINCEEALEQFKKLYQDIEF